MNKYRLVLFLYVMIFGFSTLAADSMSQLTETLTPHIGYYRYNGDLLKDLENCISHSDRVIAGRIYRLLNNAASNDKDYRAAAALKILQNYPIFNSFIKQGVNLDNSYSKAFELGRQINEDRDAIELSISDARTYLNSQPEDIYKKALRWLDSPLPLDRIKRCIIELQEQKNCAEVQEIIKILSRTSFGKTQVQAGLKK